MLLEEIVVLLPLTLDLLALTTCLEVTLMRLEDDCAELLVKLWEVEDQAAIQEVEKAIQV